MSRPSSKQKGGLVHPLLESLRRYSGRIIPLNKITKRMVEPTVMFGIITDSGEGVRLLDNPHELFELNHISLGQRKVFFHSPQTNTKLTISPDDLDPARIDTIVTQAENVVRVLESARGRRVPLRGIGETEPVWGLVTENLFVLLDNHVYAVADMDEESATFSLADAFTAQAGVSGDNFTLSLRTHVASQHNSQASKRGVSSRRK